jgi:hypothetical protein
MMLLGAHDREIPRGARDDVRCEQLRKFYKKRGFSTEARGTYTVK